MASFTPHERFTLLVSSLALVTSFATIYFQFFRVSESVTLAKLNLQMDMALDTRNGKLALDLALINNGNRDLLLLGCNAESKNVEFKLSDRKELPPTFIKQSEIKLVELRGAFRVKTPSMDEEAPMIINCRIVGPRGYDEIASATIGSLITSGGALVGQDLLKFPAVLK